MKDSQNGLIGLFPLALRRQATLALADVNYYMNNYFRGQAIVSVGVLLAVGYNIMGLPLGITIGLFIGLLNFIPYMQGSWESCHLRSHTVCMQLRRSPISL